MLKQKTQQFIKNLKAGKFLLVESDKEYRIFTPLKLYDKWMCTYWENSIEEAEKDFSNYKSEEIIDSEIDNWKITLYTPKFEPMSGKVLICDNAEEECEKNSASWNEEKEKIVGKVCEIGKYCGDYCKVWNEDESDWWYFPKTCLMYPIEESEEVEIIIDGNKKVISRKSAKALNLID